MKDVTIKGSFLKRELYILLCCIGVAVILNIFSIIKYKTSWVELFTQLHFVILVGIFIYVLVFLVLLAYRGVLKLVKK